MIFLLQSASAGFTRPSRQRSRRAGRRAGLPDTFSLSRLAYDLESLISPMLAAALLTVISFHSLFAGTVLGFLL